MKRIYAITLMFVVCVLFSQCRKPAFSEGVENFPSSLTVIAGENSKGDFEIVDDTYNVKQLLKYEWANGDVLFVYSGKEIDGEFSGSKFLGKLDLIGGKNTYIGKFYGEIAKPEPGDDMLRFIHFGTLVNNNNSTGELSVDFATQQGTLEYISDRVMAVGGAKINTNGSGNYSNVDMKPHFSVILMKFTDFQSSIITEKKDITVSGMPANQITVSTNGNIAFTAASGIPTMTLVGAIGTTSSPVNMYYTVFVPETVTTEHIFSSTISSGVNVSGTKSCKGSYQFLANKYYVKSCTVVDGNIVVTPNECVGTWEGGILPGKFKINSGGEQVQFAKGNIFYDNGSFYFHENQYDRCFSANGDVSAYYSETGRFDLFGWGTGSLTVVTDRYARPWATTTDNPEKYGPAYITSGTSIDEKYMLNNGSAGGTNYGTYDWGHNSSIIGTGWYSPSNADFKYIIGHGTDANRGSNRFAKAKITVNDVDVFGLILLPDGWTKTSVTTDPLYLKSIDDVDATGTNISVLTIDKWKVFEFAGCVFLPGSGYRSGTTIKDFNQSLYWSRSSSNDGKIYARAIIAGISTDVGTQVSGKRSSARCVRLIRKAN